MLPVATRSCGSGPCLLGRRGSECCPSPAVRHGVRSAYRCPSALLASVPAFRASPRRLGSVRSVPGPHIVKETCHENGWRDPNYRLFRLGLSTVFPSSKATRTDSASSISIARASSLRTMRPRSRHRCRYFRVNGFPVFFLIVLGLLAMPTPFSPHLRLTVPGACGVSPGDRPSLGSTPRVSLRLGRRPPPAPQFREDEDHHTPALGTISPRADVPGALPPAAVIVGQGAIRAAIHPRFTN